MLIYAGIASVGFLFLLVMLFVGDLFGADHDLVGHDVAGDFGGPSVFSSRIMAAFVTAFGVGGVVARYYDLSHPAASGVGIASACCDGRPRLSVCEDAVFAAGFERAADDAPRRSDGRSVGGDSRRRRRPDLAEPGWRAHGASRTIEGRSRGAARQRGPHHRAQRRFASS